MSKTNQISLTIFAITASYALFRYSFTSDLSFWQSPLYLLNKIMAYSALIHLGLIVFSDKLFTDFFDTDEKNFKNSFISIGIFTLSIHLIISLILLYFNQLTHLITPDNKLNDYAKLSLLFGSLNLGIFILVLSKKIKSINLVQNIFFWIFLSLHLLYGGISSWIVFKDWHWYMPPISFLAFIDAITIVIVIIFQISFRKSEK